MNKQHACRLEIGAVQVYMEHVYDLLDKNSKMKTGIHSFIEVEDEEQLIRL
jgi:hypothetical protein